MPLVESVVSCDVHKSFNVDAVAAMFDVPLEKKLTNSFSVDVPDLSEEWQVGVIVGPSGSGKSTIANKVFGESLYKAGKWPKNKAIVDAFPKGLEVKQITNMLTAVGFSSPPAWCKPYHVLSNGEQFRCDLARALISPGDVVAFDEFTSVVDRTVAKIASAAIRKSINAGHITKRFVAVTCHDDIVDWLQPEWVVDMATRRLARGCLRRRPKISLDIVRTTCEAWPLFAPHHYLDSGLNRAARCYLATWEGRPVGFVAMLTHFRKASWRFSRVVVLPDYQGIGIGAKLVDAIPAVLAKEVGRVMVSLTASHPAIVGHCNRSSKWSFTKVDRVGRQRSGIYVDNPRWNSSRGRSVATFRFNP